MTRSFGALMGRALRLRCPYCGQAPLYASWFRMHATCGACGRTLERQEEGYRAVSLFLNLVVAEAIFVVVLVTWIVASWPDVNWARIQWISVVAVCVSPMLTYPFSRAVFLAGDIHFRPQAVDDVD